MYVVHNLYLLQWFEGTPFSGVWYLEVFYNCNIFYSLLEPCCRLLFLIFINLLFIFLRYQWFFFPCARSIKAKVCLLYTLSHKKKKRTTHCYLIMMVHDFLLPSLQGTTKISLFSCIDWYWEAPEMSFCSSRV